MNAERQHGKSTLMSPANVVIGVCLLLGLYVAVFRFSQGLGGATHLSDATPWGAWVFLNLALAACVTGTACVVAGCYYFLGLPYARPFVRPAAALTLAGFICMLVVACFDMGQPWRLLYPLFFSQGTTSVLFGAGVCVFFSLIVYLLLLRPAACCKTGVSGQDSACAPAWAAFAVILTVLFQGALGGLFLLASSKIHPLWFSGHLPLLFLWSGIFGGIAAILAVALFCCRETDNACRSGFETMLIGLARAASFLMMAYLLARLLAVSMNNAWEYLGTGYGAWFFVELGGFVALPSFLFAIGVREKKLCVIKCAAVLTLVGVILNRLNVSIIAFNYQLPAAERYCPSLQELALVLFAAGLLAAVFKLLCCRAHGHENAQDA